MFYIDSILFNLFIHIKNVNSVFVFLAISLL